MVILARPQNTRGPAILVLHDMFGLNEPIRAVADRYAGLGYAALVPNLFWRSHIPERCPTTTISIRCLGAAQGARP